MLIEPNVWCIWNERMLWLAKQMQKDENNRNQNPEPRAQGSKHKNSDNEKRSEQRERENERDGVTTTKSMKRQSNPFSLLNFDNKHISCHKLTHSHPRAECGLMQRANQCKLRNNFLSHSAKKCGGNRTHKPSHALVRSTRRVMARRESTAVCRRVEHEHKTFRNFSSPSFIHWPFLHYIHIICIVWQRCRQQQQQKNHHLWKSERAVQPTLAGFFLSFSSLQQKSILLLVEQRTVRVRQVCVCVCAKE